MSRNIAWSVCGLVALLALACSPDADARSSDRNKPMIIDAGQTTSALDGSVPTVFSKGVTIDQGTLHIEAAKAVLTTDDGEVSRAVLTGSQAQLSQELDDGTPMVATADRIDYNMRTEVVVLTGDVFIKQPRNSLRGDRVVYNMRTGQLTSGGEGAGRVHMRILPKNSGNAGSDEQATEQAEPSGDVAVGAPVVAPRTDDSGDEADADEAADDNAGDEPSGDEPSIDPAEGR